MTSSDEFRVLIIGTCGLALAHGLKKEGIAFTIFERDSEDDYWNKNRDWGMQLHWGREFLYRLLPEHLQKRIREPLVDPRYEGEEPIPHINAATGQLIATIAMPAMTHISRRMLRIFLGSDQGLDISYKKRLLTVTSTGSTVMAKFDDGSEEHGNLVVGSDGSRSKVREFLVRAEAAKPMNTGMTLINHAVSGYTPEQANLLRTLHPIGKFGYDPDVQGIFLLTNVNKPEGWKFQTHHSWWGAPTVEDLSDPKARMKFYEERCSRLCEPFCTSGVALRDDLVLPLDPGQQWSPMPWDNHNGMVTLAGDAAHSMLPHRGQGLNNALQDAAEIVDAGKLAVAGRTSLKEAVTAYEDGMRPRGARDVGLSLEAAKQTLVSTLMERPMF